MRILQVVALVSGTNAYGGPTTVALNQCRALAEAGHDVVLAAAGSDLGAPLPDTVQGVRTKLFPPLQLLPGAGFAGLSSPGLLSWLRRVAASADVIHVHMARDLLTLPAAWLAQRSGTRVVLQPHGMIDASTNPLTRPLDALLTRKVLSRAERVFHLTAREAEDLREVTRGAVTLQELHNGMPSNSGPHPMTGTATSGPEGSEPHGSVAQRSECRVLYLARLQERKRPLAFVAAARALAQRFPRATFTLVGPDEGQGEAVREAIAEAGLGDRLTWQGPVDSQGARMWMARSQIYVLPSVNEPYPMSVLEAMAAGLPVVITDSCGLAETVERTGSGLVVGAEQEALENALAHLLGDPAKRSELGAAAAETIDREYAMDAVVDRLLTAYRGR
ncbi:glycosyltransferase [Kocuria sp. cx-116]|uniref:glycosyltransferase n=1 Tax=Kocuria sp. cx-116 TaxID=2771378 RepID=UPI0016896FBA|nr:glycosyltransferase [Kocuria sp. cx-116]MBD2763061.1 glycosyltransferase [Kocuria sp. cx-116]